MKIKITEEVKEEFNTKAFAYLKKLEKRIQEIEKKLKLLYLKKEKIDEALKPLKEEYDKVIGANVGKGEYKALLLEPAKIENRIKELEQGVYNSYNGITNSKNQKKYELLRRPLEEDLEIAKDKIKEYELHEKEVVENYFKEKENLKKCKKEIKNNEKEYNDKCKERTKVKLQIKKVDYSAVREKSIDERYLVLEDKKIQN